MANITEAKTRQEIIDKRLLKAGWDVGNPSQITSELDIWIGLPEGVKKPEHKHQGYQYADYALLGDDGYPLKVISAGKGAMTHLGDRYTEVADDPKKHVVIENAHHQLEDSDKVILQLLTETTEWLQRW